MSKIAEGVTCFIFNEFILMGDIYSHNLMKLYQNEEK